MPYESNADLPAGVARGLTDVQQRQFRHVFNSCSAKGKDEATCHKMANGVVKGKKEFVDDVKEVVNAETGEKDYQYVGSYEYESRAYTQQEANYSSVGGDGTRACSNCRFFVSPSRCTIVSGVIAPNGVSDLWAAEPTPMEFVMPVRIVKDDEGNEVPPLDLRDPRTQRLVDNAVAMTQTVVERGSFSAKSEVEPNSLPAELNGVVADLAIPKPGVTQESPSAVGTVVNRVKTFFASLLVTAGAARNPTGAVQYGDESNKAFSVKEMPDGSLRWLSRMSNNFKDRQGETITEAAHVEFIEWADKNNSYPELWIWHIPGSRFGATDWMAYDKGFVCASGTIDDTEEAKTLAKSLSDSKEELGVSHGFVCLKTKDGTITKYRSYEKSVLPLVNAANGWTGFDLLASIGREDKENEMAFNATKRAFLVGKGIPDDQITAWESSNETMQKALTEQGISYKSMMENEAGEVDFASEVVNQSKAIGEFVTKLDANFKSLEAQVATLTVEVKKTKDDIVAEEFKARATPGAGFAASSDSSTVVGEKAGEQLAPDLSWMDETIFKDITPSVPRS